MEEVVQGGLQGGAAEQVGTAGRIEIPNQTMLVVRMQVSP